MRVQQGSVMERNPEQAIVGQFALWVHDINPGRAYWLLILTNHGIYDDENTHITKLLQKYSQSGVFSQSVVAGLGPLRKMVESKTRLEATLDFFLWLYTEDKSLYFRVMKKIYEDDKNNDDAPEPYEPVGKLEDFEPGNNEHYPEIRNEELVSLSTRVIGEGDEFGFYRYVSEKVTEATEEVFIVDPYVDKEAVKLYLAETPEDIEKRILTDDVQGNFDEVASKFVNRTSHRVEVRTHPKCHDRLLFVDEQCFLIGSSIKDAGWKPNYVVDFDASEHFRQPWEELWDDAEVYGIFE